LQDDLFNPPRDAAKIDRETVAAQDGKDDADLSFREFRPDVGGDVIAGGTATTSRSASLKSSSWAAARTLSTMILIRLSPLLIMGVRIPLEVVPVRLVIACERQDLRISFQPERKKANAPSLSANGVKGPARLAWRKHVRIELTREAPNPPQRFWWICQMKTV